MEITLIAQMLIVNISPANWLAPIWNCRQTIGRNPECDILLSEDYRQVSRNHAALEFDKGSLWIEDLGSTGGTLINGVPLVLGHKSRVLIGDRISLAGLETYLVSPDSAILKAANRGENNSDTSVMRRKRAIAPEAGDQLNLLTPAEMEIARWICRGAATFEEIGQQLFRSPHTVRTQLGSIFRKLQVHSREQLIAWFHQNEIAWTQPETNVPIQSQEVSSGISSGRKTDFALPKLDLDPDKKFRR